MVAGLQIRVTIPAPHPVTCILVTNWSQKIATLGLAKASLVPIGELPITLFREPNRLPIAGSNSLGVYADVSPNHTQVSGNNRLIPVAHLMGQVGLTEGRSAVNDEIAGVLDIFASHFIKGRAVFISIGIPEENLLALLVVKVASPSPLQNTEAP